MNKEINLKELVTRLINETLPTIAEANNNSHLYFNERKSEWLVKSEYLDLQASLNIRLTVLLEELGFKHKD